MRRGVRARILTAACAAVLFVGLAGPAHAFAGTKTISLSNAQLRYFNVGPGDVVTGTVTVSNQGTENLKVLVYASDQVVDEKGNVTYTVPSREDLTQYVKPSTWVTLNMPDKSKSFGNVPYLDMKPNDQVPVSFKLQVPQGVAPGDHNLYIFFEMYEPPNPATGAAGQVSGRLGSRITLRVKGTIVDKIDLSTPTVPEFVISGQVPYVFSVVNSGNIDKRMSVAAGLLRGNGEVSARDQRLTNELVFAGTSREVTGTIHPSGLGLGKYNFVVQAAQIDDNGQPIAGAPALQRVKTVWMVPLWLLIVAGVVLALAIIAGIWAVAAARAKRRERDRILMARSTQTPVRDDTYHQP